MKQIKINIFFYRNSYLLVTAAWLLTLSFIIDNYWSGSSSSTTIQNAIQNFIITEQKDFEGLCNDTLLITQLATQNYDEKSLERLTAKKFFLFIYKPGNNFQDEPIFWNTQVAHPDSNVISTKEGTQLIKLRNGWYAMDVKLVPVHDTFYKVVGIIPIKWNYYITNKYLQNTFAGVNNIGNEYEIVADSGQIAIRNLEGKAIFYLRQNGLNEIGRNNIISLWLRILATLLVLIFIHVTANVVVVKKGLFRGFLFIFLPVLALRIISYFLPIPLNFRQLELFDPSIYGSNPVLRSLGDLFINSLLFVWMVFFIRRHLQERFAYKPQSIIAKTGVLVVISLVMIFITLLCGHIIRSLVADSQISFDVINFFTLNIYSVVGFFVLCCIATGYFFFLQTLLVLVNSLTTDIRQRLYLILTITGLLTLTFRLTSLYVSFDICILLWLLL